MKRVLWIASTVVLLGCGQKQIPDYLSPNFELVKLADGVFACIHKFGGKAICNAGIIDNGRETVIFDTFLSPDVAKEMQAIIECCNLSPVHYVVNSHAHNDHIRGNQIFSEDVDIISTRRTAELIEEWETGVFRKRRSMHRRFLPIGIHCSMRLKVIPPAGSTSIY